MMEPAIKDSLRAHKSAQSMQIGMEYFFSIAGTLGFGYLTMHISRSTYPQYLLLASTATATLLYFARTIYFLTMYPAFGKAVNRYLDQNSQVMVTMLDSAREAGGGKTVPERITKFANSLWVSGLNSNDSDLSFLKSVHTQFDKGVFVLMALLGLFFLLGLPGSPAAWSEPQFVLWSVYAGLGAFMLSCHYGPFRRIFSWVLQREMIDYFLRDMKGGKE
jgi:hypothetical protein